MSPFKTVDKVLDKAMSIADMFVTRMERAPKKRAKTLLRIAFQRPENMLCVQYLSTLSVLMPSLRIMTILASSDSLHRKTKQSLLGDYSTIFVKMHRGTSS